MTLQTRGSAAIDKAERRLASLKSIDENLDLGHGLTIATYTQMIQTVRSTIEAHNTLVSRIDESLRHVAALEAELADFSARMLTGVSTKYGRNSNEYRKAGGSLRKSKKTVSQSTPSTTPITSAATQPIASETTILINGKRVGNAQSV